MVTQATRLVLLVLSEHCIAAPAAELGLAAISGGRACFAGPSWPGRAPAHIQVMSDAMNPDVKNDAMNPALHCADQA